MEAWLSSFNPVLQALFGGLIITALNMLGALVVLVWRRPSQAFLDSALGFAAGVMLAASFTSLILPGVEMGGVIPVLIGIALGAVFLLAADSWVPHLHTIMGREGRPAERTSAVWLFILAITLHNMPEGLAVGVGFGSGNIGNAVALMLAIGIQNVPEGLAVSLSALSAGMGSTFYAMFVGLRAGLVEIPMALLGAWAVQIAAPILPYAMGFAAGAMLYVISDEIVPETHRMGHERWATIGIMLGVMAMLYLDVSLG
ncbi:MAG: ZIP family metal transporter [Anaerolineales bacterium]|jgi:ZIP family zinc transporter